MRSEAIIHKTKQDYNRIARHFSDTRLYIWPEFLLFKKYLKDGQHILDWGCGNGRLLNLLKDYKIKYFGVDQSEELLKIAKKNWLKEIKSGKAKFFCTASRAKKFPANFFDNIFMIASFHHLPDEKIRLRLLKKVYQEMKIGGHLIITVWNLKSPWAEKKKYQDWKEFAPNDFLIPWKNPSGQVKCERYYHYFEPEEIKNLLIKAGFKVEYLGFGGKEVLVTRQGGRNVIVIAKK